MADILSMASSLDNAIERVDMQIANLNLFEPSEHKVANLKSEDVIRSEMELEDQLSADGIVWLLEKNNRLVEQISLYKRAVENIIDNDSLSDEEAESMLDTLLRVQKSSEWMVEQIDEVIENQEKKFDERHVNCGCRKVNEDIMNYSRMNPEELKDIIEREGDEFWSRIGMSDIENDKKKLFLNWIEILAKN